MSESFISLHQINSAIKEAYNLSLTAILNSAATITNLPLHYKAAILTSALAGYLVLKSQSDAKMKLYASKTSPVKKALKSLKPLLLEYSPTIFLPGALIKDIVNILGKKVHFCKIYTRQKLMLHDHEVIALDWYPKKPDCPRRKHLPVIVFVPGTTMDSCNKVVERFVRTVKNFRVVVVNRRGYHGMPIKGSKISPFGNPTDFHEILFFVKSQFPDVNVYLLGASMGSSQLMNYAGMFRERVLREGGVKAGFFIAPTWDGAETLKKVSNFGLINQKITKNMKRLYLAQLQGQHYLKLLKEKGVNPGNEKNTKNEN